MILISASLNDGLAVVVSSAAPAEDEDFGAGIVDEARRAFSTEGQWPNFTNLVDALLHRSWEWAAGFHLVADSGRDQRKS